MTSAVVTAKRFISSEPAVTTSMSKQTAQGQQQEQRQEEHVAT